MVATSGERLQGDGPDGGSTCLLIIDMINPFTFPEAGELLKSATAAAERIAVLKRRVKQAGIPVIYVNDNVGKWQSDFRRLIEECLAGSLPWTAYRRAAPSRGRRLLRQSRSIQGSMPLRWSCG
jgi:nicotinamidase-related amidase